MRNDSLRNSGWAAILLAVALGGAGAQEHNKLTQDEAAAGYDLLFNGLDLDNWHAYRTDKVTDAWTIKTNAPLGVRIENGNGSTLPILTDKKYTNFDLKVDVQTPAAGNSGIFTRYEEVATQSGNARSGPELQICGPSHSDCVGATKHFGSCYDMFGVKESIRTTWYNPPGQWNQIRIVAFDSNYVHYGNGKKLLEYKIGTADFLRAYNESKYVSDGNNGRYYHIHPGGILLQHHGEIGISFRNLKARELEVHPFKREFPDGKWPETLPQEFAFGKVSNGVAAGGPRGASAISARRMASGATLITVPAGHAGFAALSLDGRAIPFQRVSDGVYSIGRQRHATGVVIVRMGPGTGPLKRIVSLH